MDFLSRYFEFKKHNTDSVKKYYRIATFLSMSHITVVNPSILSETGMDFGAVFVATCPAAAFGSAVMDYQKHPLCARARDGTERLYIWRCNRSWSTWQSALGAVLVSGVIFVVLSILPVRQWLINAIPRNLKRA